MMYGLHVVFEKSEGVPVVEPSKKCIFSVHVWHLPCLEMRLLNLEMAMGAARCGALATLVAMGTLGAIWVGATRCQLAHKV